MMWDDDAILNGDIPEYYCTSCAFDCPHRRINNVNARANEKSGRVKCNKYDEWCLPDKIHGVWLRCVPCVTDRNNP